MRRAINITVTVLITIAFVLLGVFVFSSSYLRLAETLVEFFKTSTRAVAIPQLTPS